MKSVTCKNRLFILTASIILLTSCTSLRPAVNTDSPNTVTSGKEETQIATQSIEENTEDVPQPSFAKVTVCNTKPETDSSTLLYGNLRINLPDGVTAEPQAVDGGFDAIDLIGAEKDIENKPISPRIWLRNYKIEYENHWELISALLDLMPDVYLHDESVDSAREYMFWFESEYTNSCIAVRGSDVYVIEQCKADYSFGALLSSGLVLWEDTQTVFETDNTDMNQTLYHKVQVEKDYTVFVQQTVNEDKNRNVRLFRDGYFSAPEMTFSFEQTSITAEFEDYNFDGCPDMMVKSSQTDIYLWNTERKQYEAAQVPAEFSQYAWWLEWFPETKTIWGSDTLNVEYGNEYELTETFWEWEGTALVKKRSCIADVREEYVRFSAYECSSGDMLFDETFSPKEWKQNSVKVQKCYQQFYAGMVSGQNDNSLLHVIDYNKTYEEYIPQKLLDKSADAMRNNLDWETFKAMGNGKELTNDEAFTIAKENLAMRDDLMWVEEFTMIMADGDNDGIMDLIAEEYFGGTGGLTQYVFYQGQEDGTYQKTSSYNAVFEDFAMIAYDGKNYLCRRLYDYNKKCYNGIGFARYVDGVWIQAVDLTLCPEEYNVSLATCDGEQYRAFAEEVCENSIAYKEMIDAHETIKGSSEEQSTVESKYEFRCDLNNDGVMEYYDKKIWLPANMGTWETLMFSGEGEVVSDIDDMLETVKGMQIMMWVEPFEGENIINVISLTGLHDFEITGFLVNGTEHKSIFRITAEAVYGVKQEISTQRSSERI